MKYYNSKKFFGKVQGKKNTNQFFYSFFILIREALNIAANYERELKDRERATNILISDLYSNLLGQKNS